MPKLTGNASGGSSTCAAGSGSGGGGGGTLVADIVNTATNAVVGTLIVRYAP